MENKAIIDLKPGQTLTNEELTNIFLCSSQGGMRKSNKTNTLVIVSNHVKSIYDDRWVGGILYYTGMGTEGDQDFYKAQNKTLYNSNTNDVSVYLFEVFVETQYTYIGKVILAGEPFYEQQPDSNGNNRKVCVFPVKVTNDEQPFIENAVLEKNRTIKTRRVKKLDNKHLLALAKKGSQNPGIRNVSTRQYDRNEAVVEFAKRIANGRCQLCREITSFNDVDGIPYLETHHIDWLSKGGSDTIENTAALCPNCHAKMHVVNDEKDIKYLKDLVAKMIIGF